MVVYDFFKYTGTDVGKSIGLYSDIEKAINFATTYILSENKRASKVEYDKENNVFVITYEDGTFENDWYAINKIKVQ